ncbi:hypothetical protein ACOSP7_022645 [Xanthoceras sorbifolium]
MYSRTEEENENTNTAKADTSSKGDDGGSGVKPEVEILALMVEKVEHQSETQNLSGMGTLNLNANSISENIGCLSNGGPPDLSVVGYRKVDDSGDGVEKILNRGISCDLSLESVGGNESKKSDLTQGTGAISGLISSVKVVVSNLSNWNSVRKKQNGKELKDLRKVLSNLYANRVAGIDWPMVKIIEDLCKEIDGGSLKSLCAANTLELYPP